MSHQPSPRCRNKRQHLAVCRVQRVATLSLNYPSRANLSTRSRPSYRMMQSRSIPSSTPPDQKPQSMTKVMQRNPGVKVRDLQGAVQTLVTPVNTPLSSRQMAQHANDRGLQYYKEKQYAEAEAQFTQALKLRPDFALAANNLGFVYYKRDQFAEAARWFENTIKIDPSRAIAYLNLGDAYVHAGDNVKAKKAYQTYLELSPTSPSAVYAKKQLEKL